MAERNKRGFAAMDREKQRAIASKGGHASHEKGTAHEFTIDEARLAGRKGGEAISGNRQHMSEIGRKGGAASGRGRARRHQEPAMTNSEEMQPVMGQPQQAAPANRARNSVPPRVPTNRQTARTCHKKARSGLVEFHRKVTMLTRG